MGGGAAAAAARSGRSAPLQRPPLTSALLTFFACFKTSSLAVRLLLLGPARPLMAAKRAQIARSVAALI